MTFTPSPQLIEKANVFSQVAEASTDILPADVSASNDPSTFRVTVAISGSPSIFDLVATSGSVETTSSFNSNVALQNGTLYTFSHGVRSGLSYNYRVRSAGVNIYQLLVEEVVGGVI